MHPANHLDGRSRLHSIGLILMILGALSLLLSIMFWSTWGGFNAAAGGRYRRQRRLTQDGAGGFVEEERADIPAA
jgi:hypothetical protein